MIVKTHAHTFAPLDRTTFLFWCSCAHCHSIEPIHSDGEYMTIPWPRWVTEPELSTVHVVYADRFICDRCFAKLPDA